MKTVRDTYPFFEANQVLSNLHLNQLFDYLSEQERLTRANLIGTGIACGLTLRFNAVTSTLQLSAGCGVTTEGYLAVEANNVELVAYRSFQLPLDIDYEVLRDKTKPDHPAYPLWELFPDGEVEVEALDSPANFLDNKTVLLFVEMKKQGLRTCSPNDCNDRGSELTVTIRRLLIDVADLVKVIAASVDLGLDMTLADLEAAMLSRLNLPDLRLPRYDVPNTSPATSQQVLAAFHAVFRDATLVEKTGQALDAAYLAFRPLLKERYAGNPFDGFMSRFGFLDTEYGSAEQITFLQYYYDLFDDVLRAYDEMRWKGVELVCACVPSELLFPRHLMLGVPLPVAIANPGLFRTEFTPACAGAGEVLRDEFVMLFQRLVEMLASFTHQPTLRAPGKPSQGDAQIRITPSVSGCAPLAERALPYYYQFNGTTPLYHVWSPARSRRARVNQNQAYRCFEYTPQAPAFIEQPLRYDLEPYNFLRIEGHLGKQIDPVLRTLLTLRTGYRLPIDVVVLRAGAFDETAPLPAAETARFPELETMYDVQREHLLAHLCESIRYLYDVAAGTKMPAGQPQHPVLSGRSPGYTYAANTLGAWYEEHLAAFLNRAYLDLNQNMIDQNTVEAVHAHLIANKQGLSQQFFAHATLVYYMTALAQAMPLSLDALDYADVENRCQDLRALTRFYRNQENATVHTDLRRFAPQEDLIDHFDQILYGSTLDTIKALHEEYLRRIRELKQQRVLGAFLRQHPGIAHKAGVPMGGTFVLVYHEQLPQRMITGPRPVRDGVLQPRLRRAGNGSIDRALERIAANRTLARHPDVQILMERLRASEGEGDGELADALLADSDENLNAAVAALASGTVIADFFLPYRCAGNGSGIEYVLPLPPLGLTIKLSCTSANGVAMATLTSAGGMEPITYQLDAQPFKVLSGPIQLGEGEHTLTIRDSAGAQSAPQLVNVPSTLRLGEADYIDDLEAMSYRVVVTVAGGVPPYAAKTGSLEANRYTSDLVPSGQAVVVEISDAAGCVTTREHKHDVRPVCNLPCDGFARRSGHRFWLPAADPQRPFKMVDVDVSVFMIDMLDGQPIDLKADVLAILRSASIDQLNRNFDKTVQGWIKRINAHIAAATGSPDWLILSYDTATARMPILWVEHFECLKFEFKIHQSWTLAEIDYQTISTYSIDGMHLVYDDNVTTIPPFNQRRIAKCDPERPVTEFCGQLDLRLEIVKEMNADEIVLEVIAHGGPQPAFYTWELQDCMPSLGIGAKVRFRIRTRQPFEKSIRLCAFTEDGCMMVVNDRINIG